MKKDGAILAASFGTTHIDALQKQIEPIEGYLRRSFHDYSVHRAFTSGMVVSTLARRGVAVDTPDIALARLARAGVREVIVQPTHILGGEEVNKLAGACEGKRALFDRLEIAAPLLSSQGDLLELTRILREAYAGVPRGTALALMGHGSRHAVNAVYDTLDKLFREQGDAHVFVGTVEAQPDAKTVVARVRRAGYQKAMLAPLMLVAGDHAKNDMAGEAEGSWKSVFERAGLEVSISLRGLGEYEGIHALYAAHTRNCM